jgi:aminoglycoside 6-adenylyltransferase
MNNHGAYTAIIEKITAWAKGQKDICAVMIIGSRARTNLPADEWSDLDVVVFARRPEMYLEDSGWLTALGKPFCTFTESTPLEERERRVLFDGMLDVDFAFIPNALAKGLKWLARIERRAPWLLGMLPKKVKGLIKKADGFKDILRRGFRVLVDKDGIEKYFTLFLSEQKKAKEPPSPHQFNELVNDFLYHLVWTVKHLKRGELWWAKSSLDMRMKWQLLILLEWHAKSIHGWDYDTWMEGRFLECWADPRAVADLRRVFAAYDEADMARALIATMELFRRLARETAGNLKYQYPDETDARITEWVLNQTR